MRSGLAIRGFTLVELLVSLSVLALIAALSIASYPKFAEQVSVSAEVYKALAYIREAQAYGYSGYTESGVKLVYGVEVDKETNTFSRVEWRNPTSHTNQAYVTNKVATNEPQLVLDNRFKIDKICSVGAQGNECQNDNYDKVYVFFKRPHPEGRIIGMLGSNIYPNQNGVTGLRKLEIHIGSKTNQNFSRKLIVLQTGQMYVE